MRTKIQFAKRAALLFQALLLFFIMAGLQIQAETAQNEDEAWRQELLKEREHKDIEFKTSTTSPMAGLERITVSAADRTLILFPRIVPAPTAYREQSAFALLFRNGSWYWDEAAPGVTCRLDGRPVAMGSEALVQGCLFTVGGKTLAAYPGPDALVMIVFDPQRPQQLAFEHLLYFPPDPVYSVKARLEKFPEKREVKIITTRKLEKTFYRYGKIRFRLEGKDLELTVLKTSLEGPDSGYLFIPFKDMTNGRESYEVGRFIDVPEPAGEEFVLDFNSCYNPLCNYSPAYNCPLPPLENSLDVAILAGEKTYPH
jgi:uncharacterized protein (DUF1684 family)